jgi:hypothetical protein
LGEGELVQTLWKTEWKWLRKLKIELSYNPAITFLGLKYKGNETSPPKRYLHGLC